jgi:hypothetical protein
VLDRTATSTDIKRLATLKRKRREKEIDRAFDSISCLATKQHSKLSFFLVMVEDTGHNIRHISHGPCFENTNASSCRNLILEPNADTDHTKTLRDFFSKFPHDQTLNFQQQMAMINCIPAVNVSFNTSECIARQSVAEGRVRTACKYLFIRAETATDINTVHAAGAASVVFRRRGSTRRGALTATTLAADECDSDCFDSETVTNEPVGERTSFTIPVIEKFKFLLQRHGLVRILKKSDCEIDIIWNKFDSVKGTFNVFRFQIYNKKHFLNLIKTGSNNLA